MLLTSPNSVAISSQANIHLSADGHISQSAGSSINLITQNNVVAHAQQKINLFAAQKGITAIAAKGGSQKKFLLKLKIALIPKQRGVNIWRYGQTGTRMDSL